MNYFKIIVYFYLLWNSFKILTIKTYGNLIFQIVLIILSFSLFITLILYIYTNNFIYLGIPILPYLITAKINNYLYKKIIKYNKN
jgi:hypothetical protein